MTQTTKNKTKRTSNKSIPEIAEQLAKATIKGMTPQEIKEWNEILKDID